MTGKIPCVRLGGRRILFHWPSVEAALLRHQRGGQSSAPSSEAFRVTAKANKVRTSTKCLLAKSCPCASRVREIPAETLQNRDIPPDFGGNLRCHFAVSPAVVQPFQVIIPSGAICSKKAKRPSAESAS
jgi:hypothetical protein